jgi:GNAT superfamily N-acetyltransferase
MVFARSLPDGFVLTDRKAALDIDVIHHYLAHESYWAQHRSRAITEAAIAGSLCVGLFTPDGRQAGFGRAVTDRATAAHLSDIFVLSPYRGGGHGRALVEALLFHPALRTVRRWSLSTADAHGLYARYGFEPLHQPEKQMIRMVDVQNA